MADYDKLREEREGEGGGNSGSTNTEDTFYLFIINHYTVHNMYVHHTQGQYLGEDDVKMHCVIPYLIIFNKYCHSKI